MSESFRDLHDSPEPRRSKAEIQAEGERRKYSGASRRGDYWFPYEALAAAIPREGLTQKTLSLHGARFRRGLKMKNVEQAVGQSIMVLSGNSRIEIGNTSQRLQEVVSFRQRRRSKLPAFPKW